MLASLPAAGVSCFQRSAASPAARPGGTPRCHPPPPSSLPATMAGMGTGVASCRMAATSACKAASIVSSSSSSSHRSVMPTTNCDSKKIIFPFSFHGEQQCVISTKAHHQTTHHAAVSRRKYASSTRYLDQPRSSVGERHADAISTAMSSSRREVATKEEKKAKPAVVVRALAASDSSTPPAVIMSADMEEATSHIRRGLPVAILDSELREGETDLFFAAEFLTPESLRNLRVWAGGELFIAIGNDVAARFGFPFIGQVLETPALDSIYPVLTGMSKNAVMCQGTCSVGLSLDHRSTHTGAPDNERSLTCRRLAELAKQASTESWSVQQAATKIGEEFHTPGHIFLCIEHAQGLAIRRGHSELAATMARLAGVTPVMVGCVMLSNEGDDFGALSPAAARQMAQSKGIPFLHGEEILAAASLP